MGIETKRILNLMAIIKDVYETVAAVFAGSIIVRKSLKDTPLSCQKALHVGIQSFGFVFVLISDLLSVLSNKLDASMLNNIIAALKKELVPQGKDSFISQHQLSKHCSIPFV